MNLRAQDGSEALWLENARVPEALVQGLSVRGHDHRTGLAITDIGIATDGTFTSDPTGARRIDLAGRIVLPTFIDSHVHLDKAYIVRRTGIPAGGLLDAVRLSGADAPNWTIDDLLARMERALSRAHANGTSALRTHLDTPVLPSESPAWHAFDRLRTQWRGRVEMQAVALMALERIDDAADYAERCRQIAERRGILGAFIAPGMATPERLDNLFEAAGRYGLDVDFHVDETLNPEARGLDLICESLERTGFAGRVMAGHCCSLGTMPPADRDRIIAMTQRAGVHVVALPTSNLFLQDRQPLATPLRRGITAVRELRAAGASVHFASDNVQDPFFPYGDFDMLDIFRTAVQVAHLDDDVGGWIAAQFDNGARACGLADHGRLSAGHPADAIILEARDLYDLMSRHHGARVVLRRGIALPPAPTALPAFPAPEFA
ncbi:MAG: cytosine deaminase [Rhodobacteraceae bacterium]|nr:cytosine deaminase [Paracoccaceae bacterium]